MRKILVDLDVVTVGTWDKGENGDMARRLMSRIVEKEFFMATPFLLLERISKWGNLKVSGPMKEFYVKNSGLLLTDEDIRARIREVGEEIKGFNEAKLLKELRRKGVGNQDAFLVLIAAVFGIDLVTFNRKTLRSKEKVVSEVMSGYGIKAPKLLGPEQLSDSSSSSSGSSGSDFNLLGLAPFDPVRSQVSFNLISQLYKFFSCHFFRVLSFQAFHAFNSYFFIYKPFHLFINGVKGVKGVKGVLSLLA